MKVSAFGERFAGTTGIGELMDDLGHALGGSSTIRMLGGGNPGHIPEVDQLWRDRMEALMGEPGRLEHVLGDYDPPQGNQQFLQAAADCLNRAYGWGLTRKNVCITNGGQTAFFFLFNLLAGELGGGHHGRILFPLMPEYIGYADQGMFQDVFRGTRPLIEHLDDHTFKYHVDFDALKVTSDIAALCVSRPTNPTGNVLTDEEIRHLTELAKQHSIPLMIDCAYGAPFPNAIYTDISPTWNENIILSFSLSKLGLPGTRTGIVVAREEIISMLSSMNAVVGLANGNVGQALVEPLLENGELLNVSKNTIKPWYQKKSNDARAWIAEFFDANLPYHVHVSEGAFFLWIWFEDLPITSQELYQRLKARDVLVVPGSYFFYGMPDAWKHRDECIRMTFSQSAETVREGLQIIADEIRKVYSVG